MKQTLLIALLSLAGFAALPVYAADTAAPEAAPAAAAEPASAPDDLAAPGPRCHQRGMGGMGGMGAMPGMGGMHGMMGGEGRHCPPGGGDCMHNKAMEARMEQLEKRIDALQLTIEMLVHQPDE
jgi:hypothetical protein